MAARFWVGGTGNWSDTARWSATSGGAGGQSVPGSADTATFNAASGGGTATVDSDVTIQTLTMTGYTGTLAFGTNSISLNSTGTVFTGAATYSVSGTPVINVTSTGSTGITVLPGAVTEANSISFNFTGGTYTLTFLGTASHAARNVDFSGYAGSISVTSTGIIYGNLTLSSAAGFLFSSSSSALTFGATSGTQVITSNGKSLDLPLTFSGAGGTRKLADALTNGSARTTTLTSGTLDLNGKTLTTGLFASSNANARTIAFGIGNITCTAAGGTVWNTQTSANLITVTGTPAVNITNSTAVATTVIPGAATEATSISFNFTAGTYALTFLALSTHAARNVNFTGFSGSWATSTSAFTIYGNLTLTNTMSNSGTGSLTFGATSGTQVLTSNTLTSRDVSIPLIINGVGGTVQLADSLRITTNLTLQNGTFDAANKGIALTGAGVFTMSTGSASIKGVTTTGALALAFTQTSGTLTQIGDNTFRAFTLTSGTLNLGSYTLTCASFASSNSGVRTIAFGTGNITCSSTVGGTLWNTATSTNLTISGTPAVNITYSGAVATTIASGATTEATALSFNITTGSYVLTSPNFFNSLTFAAAFTGTWTPAAQALTCFGGLTLSSAMTFGGGNGGITFAATSGTQTITSNGEPWPIPITQGNSGATLKLADALTQTTYQYLHNSGTLDLNGKTLTPGTNYTTGTGTKNITFNGGTLSCGNSFNNAVPTGFTTTAGTGTGKISMTRATAQSFTGGGSTYNCTLSNDGAGALTISGSNTFTTIANGVQPTTFTFTSSTTQTVTNWSVSGLSGQLVTINSSTAGTAATLSKASGTVSSDYLSMRDSTATGGAAWYAGANSTNTSNNTGWVFTSPPITAEVTGVFATSAVGTPLTGVVTPVDVTGIASVTAVGDAVAQINISLDVTGLSSTSSVGTAVVSGSTSVAFDGWNRTLGWGIGPFGSGAATVGLATGEVGTPTLLINSDVLLTGVVSTVDVGTPTVTLLSTVQATGVTSTTGVGSPTVDVSATSDVTGQYASGEVGTVTIDFTVRIPVTGVPATGYVGDVTAVVDCSVPLSGVFATGSVGDSLVEINASVSPTGYVATGYVGQVTVTVNSIVNLAGVYATGYVGQALVWGQIIPGQTPAWAEIDPTQSASWTQITPSQTPVWTEISA